MPRSARKAIGGLCYHIHHRTIQSVKVFEEAEQRWRFLELVKLAQTRVSIELLAACVMPDHFHVVVRPGSDEDLGRWMQWLLTTHVRRWHSQQHSAGPIWWGRFKAFAIAQDKHLVRVMAYVERNALRAGLVERAEQWPWGSLNWRYSQVTPVALTPPPVPLPQNWVEYVNAPENSDELEVIRVCVSRQRSFGDLQSQSLARSDLVPLPIAASASG